MLNLILLMGAISLAVADVLGPTGGDYPFADATEYRAIMGQLKAHGGFAEKAPPVKEDIPRAMSRGERAVEEAKARNRSILAQKHKEDQAKEKKEGLAAWKDEVKATQKQWKKEVESSLAEWKKEQDIFLGRIKIYKENTFDFPLKQEKIIEKKVPVELLPDAYVVNAAFLVPVRDQKNRATCSAFAGLRAVEILLAQNKLERDLSEQYFYWSSKPNCQKSPCKERGSWVTSGFARSQSLPDFDVPLESQCAYRSEVLEDNETQLPLGPLCGQGSIKILAYEEVRTLAEVVDKLKKNMPVIMAARLSENFYRNKGLVRLMESDGNIAKLDAHSKGHAFLAVGVIELPEKLHHEEGGYCLMVANSWGKGWGAGGYACLTEKWLMKFRQASPFVAVAKVSSR